MSPLGLVKMTLIMPRLAKELRSSGTQLRAAQIDQQIGARTVSTSLLSPINPNDHVGSYNLQWCVLFPDDNGNKGFGFSWMDLHPFYWAI